VPSYPVLTEIMVKAAKPPARGTITLWDGAQKHFGIRINQGGAKSFIVLTGSGRREAIGRYPTISLAAARTRAKELLAERTLGKTRPRAAAFDDVLDLFLAACEKKNRSRTVRDYTRLLKRHFAFGRKNLSDITRHDISQKLEKLKHMTAEQNHALVAAKIFFKWAMRNGYIEQSPCEGFSTIKRLPRERVLSDDELRAVFRTAIERPSTFSHIVALLVLTGQRRSEIAALKWEWIDTKERTITLPAAVTKNKRTHRFPYGEMVAKLLEQVPQQSEYLFPAARDRVNGKAATVFNGWGKPKETFDSLCKVSDWQLHDLRRTFASNLAALGVSLPTIEKLLNHVSGSFGGIVSVYQRHDWLPEMREAIRKWEHSLNGLMTRVGK
jgi:integrase